MSRAEEFLEKHGMSPENICPGIEACKMRDEMLLGLKGEKCSVPMIPTYLKAGRRIEKGRTAAVIDAGGTNFRSALVTFTDDGYIVESLSKCKMPGTEKPADWDDFISFTADRIEPLMSKTDAIGFCFSYSADITPEIDGKVRRIDKEVVINNSAGKLVGSSLKRELERRGIFGKKIVVLNDTAAVMLGGASGLRSDDYEGFIGQVSGTGTNTCCAVPVSEIKKLGISGDGEMIINTESGMYDGFKMGDFDKKLDELSINPGMKHMEKLTSGVYLGPLFELMMTSAAQEGYVGVNTRKRLEALKKTDGADIDAWSVGKELSRAAAKEDEQFVQDICRALLCRSARCMCTNLGALLLLTGKGKNKPVCVCAEGSLVQKSEIYKNELKRLMKKYIEGELGLKAVLMPVEESTLPGSAAAALLNL